MAVGVDPAAVEVASCSSHNAAPLRWREAYRAHEGTQVDSSGSCRVG